MSLQAGLLFDDARPLDTGWLRAFAAPLRARRPETFGLASRAGLAMAVAGFAILPEDRETYAGKAGEAGEAGAGSASAAQEVRVALARPAGQPYASARGHLVTWDGRLDNRADICQQLGIRQQTLSADIAIVAAAYDRWGAAAFARLRGDWSLAIHDRDADTVTLASDYLGVKPLYYCRGSTRSAWSSALDELAIREDRARSLDPAFIAGCLAVHTPSNRTPYEGILAVPPGHAVTLRRGGDARIARFWECPVRSIRYAAIETYAEHLRAVFADALRARLRAIDPVWCLLSGGLDSSCIVSAIHTIGAGRINTLSFVTNSSPESDERPFIRSVEEAYGLDGTHMVAEDHAGAIDPDRAWIHPEHVKGVELAAQQRIRARGGRVILSGVGGDSILANYACHTPSIADAIAAGALLRAGRDARAWALAAQHTFFHLVADALLHILAPARRDPVIAPFVRQLALIRQHGYLADHLLDALGAEHMHLLRQRRAGTPKGLSPSAAYTCSVLARYAASRHARTPGEAPDLAYTFPYLDQTLVELVLAIPAHILTRPGRPRALMHDAFDAILPPLVRARFSKGYAAPYLTRLLRTKLTDLRTRMPRLQLVTRGYVKPQFLQRLLDSAGMQSDASSLLSAVVRTEEWLGHHAKRWKEVNSDDIPDSGTVDGRSSRGARAGPHWSEGRLDYDGPQRRA